MLTALLAHAGEPPAPHDLWAAWNLDPALIAGVLLAVLAYWRGHTRGGHGPTAPRWPPRGSTSGSTRWSTRWRAWCFTGALLALGVALVSPLDAMSTALASAHMVQHMLLVLAAAPLLALAAPGSTLLRGSPLGVRRAAGRWRRRLRLTRANLRPLRHPVVLWLLHTVTLWLWHAAVPYGAALGNQLVHAAEHASFLVTAWLFWQVVIGTRSPERVPNGLGVLLVFTMAMQSVLLSVLLTFARAPWYSGYATTTTPWGLSPLADQQLAGVIMWIPAGAVYVGVALTLIVTWLRTTERHELAR